MKNSLLVTLSLILVSTVFANERFSFPETSLDETGCVLVDSDVLHENAEIDFFNLECPGLAGFRVVHSGGDLRSTVTLIKNKRSSQLRLILKEGELVTFPSVSSKSLKWAFRIVDNKKVEPMGVWFQMSGQDESTDTPAEAFFDIIAKFKGDKVCVVSSERSKGAETDALALEKLKVANTLKCID